MAEMKAGNIETAGAPPLVIMYAISLNDDGNHCG